MTIKLGKAYERALEEMCADNHYKTKTEALKLCIIEQYMRTHTVEAWGKLIDEVYGGN